MVLQRTYIEGKAMHFPFSHDLPSWHGVAMLHSLEEEVSSAVVAGGRAPFWHDPFLQ